MKRPLVWLLLLLMTLSAMAQSPRLTMQWQNTQREYLVIQPSSHSVDTPLPVLFFLHGLGGDINRYERFADFQAIADSYGWLIVMPQALPTSVNVLGYDLVLGTMWNAGLAVPFGDTVYTPNSQVDDGGFLLALIDTLGLTFQLDPDSIFFSGVSMGGFMTHRMAVDHADRISGAAAVSGLMATSLAECTPARPIPILHIHGTDDEIVSFEGTCIPMEGIPPITLGLNLDQVLAYWIEHNQCSDSPIIDSLADRLDDGLRFVQFDYPHTEGGAPLRFIKVLGGQHEWYMDETRYDIDYIVEIHSFFTGQPSHYNAIPPIASTSHLALSPNPARAYVAISVDSPTQITLFDLHGRRLMTRNIGQGNTQLDLSSLAPGVYIVRTIEGDIQKLIIQ